MNHKLIAQKLEEIIELLIEDAEDTPEESDVQKVQSLLRRVSEEDLKIRDIHEVSFDTRNQEFIIRGCYDSDTLCRMGGGIKQKAETNRDRLVKGLKDVGFIEMDVDKFLKMLRDEETED